MSVLIKGTELPKDHVRVLVLHPDGRAIDEWGNTYQASLLPPHGRLIDADELMKEFEKAQRTMQQHGQEYSCSFLSSSQEISTEWYCVEDMLDNAPTIIPADDKDINVLGKEEGET